MEAGVKVDFKYCRQEKRKTILQFTWFVGSTNIINMYSNFIENGDFTARIEEDGRK